MPPNLAPGQTPVRPLSKARPRHPALFQTYGDRKGPASTPFASGPSGPRRVDAIHSDYMLSRLSLGAQNGEAERLRIIFRTGLFKISGNYKYII